MSIVCNIGMLSCQQLLHYRRARDCSGFRADAVAGNSGKHSEQTEQNLSPHGGGEICIIDSFLVSSLCIEMQLNGHVE